MWPLSKQKMWKNQTSSRSVDRNLYECEVFCSALSPRFNTGMQKSNKDRRDGALASSNDDSKMSSDLTLLEVSACI